MSSLTLQYKATIRVLPIVNFRVKNKILKSEIYKLFYFSLNSLN